MAAIKYYRAQVRGEGRESVFPEEQEVWEEPLEAGEDGTEDTTIFVASLLVDPEALVGTGKQARIGLGRVEVRKVILREA